MGVQGLSRFFSQHLGFNISSPEGALVRVLITTLPKNLQDADPTKHGKRAVLNFFILYTLNFIPLVLDFICNLNTKNIKLLHGSTIPANANYPGIQFQVGKLSSKNECVGITVN